MEYKLNKQVLLEHLGQWNGFLRRKIHFIACGGTALTLLEIKASTKDVDFMVPVEAEYSYIIKILKDLGYRQTTGSGWQRKGEPFIFDLFRGNRIHTTELLESPLEEGNHLLLHEFSNIYVGILNEYDLIVSKLFRGSPVDFEDCLMLVRARRAMIDIGRLEQHYSEMAKYDVAEDRLGGTLEHFLDILRREQLYG